MEVALLFLLVIVWARYMRTRHELRETRWKLRRSRRNGHEHP